MNREKTILMIAVLVQQLRVWLKHARDLGTMRGEFKYISGILLNAVERFHAFIFSGHAGEDDEIYEHSVKLSELVEKLVQLEDKDLHRVELLADKIKRDRINLEKATQPGRKAA